MLVVVGDLGGGPGGRRKPRIELHPLGAPGAAALLRAPGTPLRNGPKAGDGRRCAGKGLPFPPVPFRRPQRCPTSKWREVLSAKLTGQTGGRWHPHLQFDLAAGAMGTAPRWTNHIIIPFPQCPSGHSRPGGHEAVVDRKRLIHNCLDRRCSARIIVTVTMAGMTSALLNDTVGWLQAGGRTSSHLLVPF